MFPPPSNLLPRCCVVTTSWCDRSSLPHSFLQHFWDDVFSRNTVITAKFALAWLTHTRTRLSARNRFLSALRAFDPNSARVELSRGVCFTKRNELRELCLSAALARYSLRACIADTWCAFGFGGAEPEASEELLNLRALSAYHPWLSSVPTCRKGQPQCGFGDCP